MAERIDALHDFNADVDRAIDQVKADVDHLIGGLEVDQLARKVEDLGRANPLGLAIGSLVLGLAAGLLIRRERDPGAHRP